MNKEERVTGIDWEDTPLDKFYLCPLSEEDEKTMGPMMLFPPGDGMAHKILTGLLFDVKCTYEALLAAGDIDWFEKTGEVPVIRNGQRGYELFEKITLSGDLPAVLDTLVVLEEEREKEKLAEAERKRAEAKKRKSVLAKERCKLKKLGEW